MKNRAPTHIISIKNIEKRLIDAVFSRAQNIGHRHTDTSLQGKSGVWISPESSASTRTYLSFETAIRDLGGECSKLPENSSMKGKQESFRDTVQVLGAYFDVIIIRSDKEQPYEAARWSPVPVINAGNGPDEHPTQTLLDGFTIKEHFGEIAGLKIALVGDLHSGRAPRGLALLIATHFPDNELIGVGPEEFRMGEDVKQELKRAGVDYRETEDIEDVIGLADVFYMTRWQKEYSRKGMWYVPYPRLTLELARKLNKHALILHPLPRNDGVELPYTVDDLPQAAYLKQQLHAGPRVRKALLQELLLHHH